MPNSVRISIRDKDGYDLAAFMDALEQGFMMDTGSMELTGSGGTALMSTDAGTMELQLHFSIIDGELHATGLVGWEDGAVAFTADFSSPAPLGFKGTDEELAALTASDWSELATQALTGSAWAFRGSGGDDYANGSEFADRLIGRAGDDVFFGMGGNDLMKGGNGDDVLVGGPGNDRLFGGADNDLLVTGQGRDRADGGRGNDIFVDMGNGDAQWTGGQGADMFLIGVGGLGLTAQIDGFAPTEGTGRTVITDFGAEDVLVFNSVSPTGTGGDQGVWTDMRPGATLADWNGTGADEFSFRETKRGVEMVWGEEEIFLRGVAADQVLLDQIHFGSVGFLLGAGIGDVAHSPAGSKLDVWKAPAGVMVEYGFDEPPFETIMFETLLSIG